MHPESFACPAGVPAGRPGPSPRIIVSVDDDPTRVSMSHVVSCPRAALEAVAQCPHDSPGRVLSDTLRRC
jgi:hypothetical protein